MSFLHEIPGILKNSLTITCLVMLMLLLIEFINVSSSGKLLERLRHRPFLQIVISTLLGLTPGCIGGFTIVSLYTHKLMTFGALVAGMIATFGDEAFIMFSISPKATLMLCAVLLVVAIVAGVFTDLVFKHKSFYAEDTHTLEIHENHHSHSKIQLAFSNIKNISFARATLIFGLVVHLIALSTGTLSHEHGSMPDLGHQRAQTETHEHEHECGHGCEHECEHATAELSHAHETLIPTYHSDHEVEAHAHHHGVLSWENILFGIIAIITLIIVAFSPEHFLQEHLWEHVIKNHFLSVLLWTLGVLLVLGAVYHFWDVNALIEEYKWATLALLLLAVLLGIIPESGPHLVFVVMYFSGAIPFSILLASSVVQDGHGALPLLAYSRKSFLMMKAINVVFGLIVGLIGYFIGF